ncbi:MAG: hypothetical protein M0Q19_06090, partial [Candidatus Cloacimonetes bacterium]|nr:hypothetical protein [Candidatus Cloacimonadota bacterium]
INRNLAYRACNGLARISLTVFDVVFKIICMKTYWQIAFRIQHINSCEHCLTIGKGTSPQRR